MIWAVPLEMLQLPYQPVWLWAKAWAAAKAQPLAIVLECEMGSVLLWRQHALAEMSARLSAAVLARVWVELNL